MQSPSGSIERGAEVLGVIESIWKSAASGVGALSTSAWSQVERRYPAFSNPARTLVNQSALLADAAFGSALDGVTALLQSRGLLAGAHSYDDVKNLLGRLEGHFRVDASGNVRRVSSGGVSVLLGAIRDTRLSGAVRAAVADAIAEVGVRFDRTGLWHKLTDTHKVLLAVASIGAAAAIPPARKQFIEKDKGVWTIQVPGVGSVQFSETGLKKLSVSVGQTIQLGRGALQSVGLRLSAATSAGRAGGKALVSLTPRSDRRAPAVGVGLGLERAWAPSGRTTLVSPALQVSTSAKAPVSGTLSAAFPVDVSRSRMLTPELSVGVSGRFGALGAPLDRQVLALVQDIMRLRGSKSAWASWGAWPRGRIWLAIRGQSLVGGLAERLVSIAIDSGAFLFVDRPEMGKTAERIVTFVPEEYPITLDEAWSKALGSAGRPKTMNVWLDSLPTSAFQGIGRRLSITREKTTWLLPSYQDSRTRRALAVAVDMMPTTHLGLKVDSDPDGTRVTLAVRS